MITRGIEMTIGQKCYVDFVRFTTLGGQLAKRHKRELEFGKRIRVSGLSPGTLAIGMVKSCVIKLGVL